MLEANDFLEFRQKQNRKIDPSLPKKPKMGDVARLASMTLLEAALTVNPHFVLIFSGMFLHPDTIRLMYRMGAPMALLLTESPYDDRPQSDIAPYCNVVFTNERGSAEWFRRQHALHQGKRGNANTFYLPHAYDPGLHTAEESPEDTELYADLPRHDVVFVGSGFIERQDILEAIPWSDLGLDFGLYGPWPYLSKRSPLQRYWRDKVIPNEKATALYRRARVGLNIYRTSVGTSRNATHITGAESLNPRALELAATGCFQVSSWRPEVEEVFGSLVPTFKTATELANILPAAVDGHDKEGRVEYGRLLRQAVQGWTFDERAAQVSETLERFRPGSGAGA